MTQSQRKVVKPRLSAKPSMRFLRSIAYPLERDLLHIAIAVFEAEKLARSGPPEIEVVVPVSLASYSALDLEACAAAMSDALTSVYPIPTSFQFKITDTRHLKRKTVELDDVEAVVLFSGGLDSLAALMSATRHFSNVAALFVAHSDQGGLVKIVNDLEKSALASKGVRFQTIHVPAIGRSGYSQMRGFLYVMCGVLFAHATRGKNVIVGETGPTMYQPQFGPFDQVTMTSHPIILKAVARIASALPRPVRIVVPLEDLTKAEAVRSIETEDFKYLPYTHSCVSQRFRDHDGTCYGCVIRRIGTLVAGAPDVQYRKDVLSDQSARVGNFVSLLRFCNDVLNRAESLPSFSSVAIEEYGKLDLFKRFAQDTFCSLDMYRESGGRFSPRILKAISAYVSPAELVAFADRAKIVRRGRKGPNYGPKSVVRVRG